ncbi:serine protease [bacterium]|nr:serine protease [bacterium]
MKIRMLLFCLFFFVTDAMAISDAIIVKTKSFPCHDEAKAFRGSGTLFTHEGVIYALTSEHVVLQSNENICHQVQNSSLGIKKAELVAADWGVGLALLKLTEPVSIVIPNYKDLKPRAVSEGANVISYGFPYASWFSIKKEKAVIASLDSGKGTIPLAPRLIEAVGGWVEYGMSGGPVFTEGTDTFAGVLTHQGVTDLLWYQDIPIDPKTGPKVEDLFFFYRNPSKFFIIPSVIATQWIRNIVINEKVFRSSSKRDAELQLAGKGDVVFSSGFQFESRLQPSSGPIGGPEGVGRTGNGPIGGPEGVGRIGGSENSTGSAPYFAHEIIISKDTVGHRTHWPLILNRFPYLEEQLDSLNSVTIPYFVKRGPNDGKSEKVYFSSLAEFFTLLQDPSLDTMVQRPPSSAPTMGTVTCSNADFSVVLKETADLTKRIATLTTSGQSVSLSCEGWTDDPTQSLQFNCRSRDEALGEKSYLVTVLIYQAQGSGMIAAVDSSGAVQPSKEISCGLRDIR